jgi:UDP-N-acetylmuramate dehydrogenase
VLGKIVGAVRFKEPLSFHTSLRIGGPADFFVMAQDLDDVRYAQAFAEQEGFPAIVMGEGNNLLVSARGVRALLIKLQGILGRAEFSGEEVATGAGVSLSDLIREAASRDLGGIECLAGIPCSLGAALAGNVGTRDGSILDFCTAVYFLYPDGTLGEVRPLGHTMSRSFDVPPGSIYVGCRMQLARRPEQEIYTHIRQLLKPKKATQPVALASAGYIWRDPPGELAERLINAAGMRGKRMNGAEISSKCGNFIINRGGATDRDVLALMEMTRGRVEARFGVTLTPHIHLLGFGGEVFSTPRLEPAGELVGAH